MRDPSREPSEYDGGHPVHTVLAKQEKLQRRWAPRAHYPSGARELLRIWNIGWCAPCACQLAERICILRIVRRWAHLVERRVVEAGGRASSARPPYWMLLDIVVYAVLLHGSPDHNQRGFVIVYQPWRLIKIISRIAGPLTSTVRGMTVATALYA